MVCCLLIEFWYKSQHKFLHLNSCIVGELNFVTQVFIDLIGWIRQLYILCMDSNNIIQWLLCITIIVYSYRKAILPIEAELGNVGESEGSASESESDEELDSYIKKIKKLRDNLFSVAKTNIDDAQLKQKRDYDRKHGVNNKKVSTDYRKFWFKL